MDFYNRDNFVMAVIDSDENVMPQCRVESSTLMEE
jgi:hypothetical protein